MEAVIAAVTGLTPLKHIRSSVVAIQYTTQHMHTFDAEELPYNDF